MSSMGDKLATWLNQQLEEKGWSYRELGRRSGIAFQSIARYADGTRNPGTRACRKMAKALDVPYEEIMRLAGHLPLLPEPPGDLREDELELTNALRRERGKRELIVEDFRNPFDPDDRRSQKFWRIWHNLPDDERLQLIELAESLDRDRDQREAR
jgi:transcriptional regulator with XRE-family HTH domain